MKCGFVGLGQMGAPMASNLAARFPTVVFDRNAHKRDAIGGATAVGSLAGLAGADAVFLCLPDTAAVESILFGEDGLAPHLAAGAVVIDTSTINYDATLQIATQLSGQGVGFVDAPISGMGSRAADGTLTMMCGGAAAAVDALRPAFETMASTVLHMGAVGAGQLTKLINQLLFDINAAALAEILPLAAKLGLDPAQVGDVVNSGTGRSHASEAFIPSILRGEFETGYPMQAAYKDLISGAQVSAKHGVPLPVLAAATATYQQALLRGHGDKDKGGMIRVFEDLLGVEFRAKGTSNG